MKIKKAIIKSLLAIQLLVIFTPSTITAQPTNSNIKTITSSIAPRVNYVDWQYKVEGNTVYRRLYNFSTNTPLSDWEIVP